MIEKINSDICAGTPKKWHNAPQTIYSFFIMIALSWHKKRNINKSKLCKALMVAGTTLFFSIIAESLIIIELARHTETLVNETLEEGSVETSHLPMVQFVCITLFLVVPPEYSKQFGLNNIPLVTFEDVPALFISSGHLVNSIFLYRYSI